MAASAAAVSLMPVRVSVAERKKSATCLVWTLWCTSTHSWLAGPKGVTGIRISPPDPLAEPVHSLSPAAMCKGLWYHIALGTPLEAVITQTLLKKKTGGRVAALEIMVATTAVRNLIREGKLHQIPGIMQASQKDGMQTMDMALFDLATRGIVTKGEAQSRSMNPNLFGSAISGAA